MTWSSPSARRRTRSCSSPSARSETTRWSANASTSWTRTPGRWGSTSVQLPRPGVATGVDHHLEVLGAVGVGEHEEAVAVLGVDVVLDRVLERRSRGLDDTRRRVGGRRTGGSAPRSSSSSPSTIRRYRPLRVRATPRKNRSSVLLEHERRRRPGRCRARGARPGTAAPRRRAARRRSCGCRRPRRGRSTRPRPCRAGPRRWRGRGSAACSARRR